MGWLIALILLVLLLRMKVGMFLSWKDKVFSWKLRLGFLRLTIVREKPSAGVTPKKAGKGKKKTKGVRDYLPIFWEHWAEILELVGKILHAPSMERLELSVIAGGKDPGDCAMNYGKICAVLSAALPAVCQVFSIQAKNIEVSCRYDQPNTTVDAQVELVLRLSELIVLLIAVPRLLISIKRSMDTTQKAV